MSIECCQRSPSLPSSSSPPMHSSLGAGQPPSLEQYTFLVPAEVGSSNQQRASRMLKTDVPPTDSVSTGTALPANRRPPVPPRPPPRHSSTSSSTTLTSNNNNINTTDTTTATTSSPSSIEPPLRPVNKQFLSEPSSQSSPIIAETTGSISHASTSGSSTPPVIRWGKNFNDLLSDKEGLDLFTKFLQEEAQLEDLINFFFTCKSIKLQENRPHVAKLAKAIIKKYILGKSGNCSVGRYLSDGVKSKLLQVYKRINENKVEREPESSENSKESDASDALYSDEFYMNLFNEAQTEIYNHLNDNLYQNFIRHDIYLRHLR